ncbi:MAG: hypothetical protein RLZZ366_1371, partial [Pseudomonadota bacterium]
MALSQEFLKNLTQSYEWFPACAGMTGVGLDHRPLGSVHIRPKRGFKIARPDEMRDLGRARLHVRPMLDVQLKKCH